MINKKYMNYIIKELKKNENVFMIKYLPNEEEKEYLKSFNIKTEITIVKQKGLISNMYYDTEYCIYYLD